MEPRYINKNLEGISLLSCKVNLLSFSFLITIQYNFFFFCKEKNSSCFRHSLHLHIFPPRFLAECFPRFQAVSAFPALAIILVPRSSRSPFPASLIALDIRMAHFSVGIIPFIRQWLLTPDYPKTITQQREFLSVVKTSTIS